MIETTTGANGKKMFRLGAGAISTAAGVLVIVGWFLGFVSSSYTVRGDVSTLLLNSVSTQSHVEALTGKVITLEVKTENLTQAVNELKATVLTKR